MKEATSRGPGYEAWNQDRLELAVADKMVCANTSTSKGFRTTANKFAGRISPGLSITPVIRMTGVHSVIVFMRVVNSPPCIPDIKPFDLKLIEPFASRHSGGNSAVGKASLQCRGKRFDQQGIVIDEQHAHK